MLIRRTVRTPLLWGGFHKADLTQVHMYLAQSDVSSDEDGPTITRKHDFGPKAWFVFADYHYQERDPGLQGATLQLFHKLVTLEDCRQILSHAA